MSPSVSPGLAPRVPATAGRTRSARSRSPAWPLPGPVSRLSWEQLGRAAMLCVMVALLYLYLSAGIRMFSTWRQSRHDHATVRLLEAEHSRLLSQHELLASPQTVVQEARRLGMSKTGEQQYVLSGLPND